MIHFTRPTPARWLALPLLAITIVACGGRAASLAPATASAAATPSASAAGTSQTPSPITSEAPTASPSQEPDTGGLTTAGDIPDNATFLTYHDISHGFSIQYVEGWQVTPGPDGVVVRDKDSSETVATVAKPADVRAFITDTDLPSLQAQPGYKLVKQDTVKVGSATYDHVVVNLPAPPDPVTGKQVPSTVDRYYVPGPNGLAIISLSTPNGVDNVDAFRQMIESFTWS
jgi:hypothetical protein